MFKFPMRVVPAPVFIEPEYGPVFGDDYFPAFVLHNGFKVPIFNGCAIALKPIMILTLSYALLLTFSF
jgi:hypothetical protein